MDTVSGARRNWVIIELPRKRQRFQELRGNKVKVKLVKFTEFIED